MMSLSKFKYLIFKAGVLAAFLIFPLSSHAQWANAPCGNDYNKNPLTCSYNSCYTCTITGGDLNAPINFSSCTPNPQTSSTGFTLPASNSTSSTGENTTQNQLPQTKCNKCDRTCDKSTCLITKKVGYKSYGAEKIKPNCVINANTAPTACIDTMPIKAAGFTPNIASPVGFRKTTIKVTKNGKNTTEERNRFHYGIDYGTAGKKGVAATAPADGRIVSCRNATGGGRAIYMEHEGHCGNEHFYTVFYHLAAWVMPNGTQSKTPPKGCARTIKKGEVIGIVGGSSATKDGKILENYYATHLHFEIHNKKNVNDLKGEQSLNPLCDDVQKLCGGCPTKLPDNCGALSLETLANMAQYGSPTDSSPQQWDSVDTHCPLETFTSDQCIFCDLFRVLFNTASVMSLKAYKTFADAVSAVVLIGFAVWISFVVLKQIAAVEVKEPRKFLQEILVQAFRVLLVFLILRGSFFSVISMTVEPVFNTGLLFVQKVMNQESCSTNASYMKDINGYASTSSDNVSGGLPLSMGQSIVCTIKSVEDGVGMVMAYGKKAVCASWHPTYALLGFIPHPALFITGCLLYIGGLLLLLAFPWCLVDCVLNLCIAVALLPAAIGAWAFKITQKYLKKIWDFFMNAMFNFVFLGIIIYIIIEVARSFLAPLDGADNINTLTDPVGGLAYWGVNIVKVMTICLLGWVYLDEGKEFADKFAKSAGVSGIGRSVGGMFAQAAQKAGSMGMKAGKNTLRATGKVGGHFIGRPLRQALNRYRTNRVKRKGQAITDENGNITGYVHTSRGIKALFRKSTKRVDIDPKTGKETWSREVRGWGTSMKNAAKNMVNKRRIKKILKDGTYVEDQDGNIIYTREVRSIWRLGRKVQLTAKFDKNDQLLSMDKNIRSARNSILATLMPKGSAAQQFFKRNNYGTTRNLMPSQAATRKYKDHMMTVAQKLDRNGNVISEEAKLNSNIKKYLINKDGSLNQKMIANMVAGSNFDEATIYRALAGEIMERRGISVDKLFQSRSFKFENGAMSIQQVNSDGSSTEINLAFVPTVDKNGKVHTQMILDIKNTDLNGNYHRVLDNGIMRKTVQYTAGKDHAVASFSFNEHYANKNVPPLNRHGEFTHVDASLAMAGFTTDDYLAHTQQVRTNKHQLVDAAIEGALINVFDQAALHSDDTLHTQKLRWSDYIRSEIRRAGGGFAGLTGAALGTTADEIANTLNGNEYEDYRRQLNEHIQAQREAAQQKDLEAKEAAQVELEKQELLGEQELQKVRTDLEIQQQIAAAESSASAVETTQEIQDSTPSEAPSSAPAQPTLTAEERAAQKAAEEAAAKEAWEETLRKGRERKETAKARMEGQAVNKIDKDARNKLRGTEGIKKNGDFDRPGRKNNKNGGN